MERGRNFLVKKIKVLIEIKKGMSKEKGRKLLCDQNILKQVRKSKVLRERHV
jgi:hypothetical protein